MNVLDFSKLKLSRLIRLPSRNSMRARMTLAFTLSIALLLVAADGALIIYSRHAAHKNVERLLDQSALEMQRELTEPPTSALSPAQFAHVEGDELRGRGVSLLLLDAHRRIVVAPRKLAASWPLSEKEWRMKRVPWREYSFVLAVPWQHRARDLNVFAGALVSLSALIIAACALGAWLLVGRVLAPLEALSAQAQSASTQFPSHRIGAHLKSPSDDLEMTELVATLNSLLLRLDADTRSKARFYAAASHELRTPLQSLSGFLELGLARERSREEYRIALEEAQTQSGNLIALVQELLALNQLEAATSNPPCEEIDFADVAQRALQRLCVSIEQRNLRVETEVRNAGVLSAPPIHLEMLISNLLDNAVKYATPGTVLYIRCEASTFEACNECESITGWDDAKIFEPFFRPDESRNSQTGGNGLGLAICKGVCDANGWKLQVQQTPTGVATRVDFSDDDSSHEDSSSTRSAVPDAPRGSPNAPHAALPAPIAKRSFSL
jgi:signal transduction histidine kinase